MIFNVFLLSLSHPTHKLQISEVFIGLYKMHFQIARSYSPQPLQENTLDGNLVMWCSLSE